MGRAREEGALRERQGKRQEMKVSLDDDLEQCKQHYSFNNSRSSCQNVPRSLNSLSAVLDRKSLVTKI